MSECQKFHLTVNEGSLTRSLSHSLHSTSTGVTGPRKVHQMPDPKTSKFSRFYQNRFGQILSKFRIRPSPLLASSRQQFTIAET